MFESEEKMGNKNQFSEEPLVSIIIPNYNGERFARYAIDSALAQTYRNIEIIVVDDCSTDNSPDYIRDKYADDSRLRLIAMDKNMGVANARNAGIKEARGEYIALLDNDDVWEKDKLARQMALAKQGADIVYCSYDFIDEDNSTIKRAFIVPERTDFDKMLASNVISCSTGLFKAELLKEHPFRTEYYHEDYVLWMELLRLPVKAVGDPKVLMHYRQVKGSRSNKKVNAAKERWNIYRGALGMNFLSSANAFFRYAINGLRKYL